MKQLTLFLILCLFASPCIAQESTRYLDQDKVVFEDPQEEDVLKVNMSYGFLTVLEFPEKPVMVAVGDDTLLQVEVPDNSRNVVVKPMEESGTTNLFVFTPSKRFNYQVSIGMENTSDYVVDNSESSAYIPANEEREDVSLVDLIKMSKNYPVLKELGNVDEKNVSHQKLFQLCSHPKVAVVILDVFQYKHPDYVIVHFRVKNDNYKEMLLSEKNTSLYVNEKMFVPQYVLFDQVELDPNEKTEGWLFIKDSHLSLENKFQIVIGAGDETYKCR